MRKKQFFFVFFPELFRILSKNFSDFRPKNFKKFSKLPTCPEEKFVTWFFLSFQTFRIFCRNVWHGSQNSIYVSRVKIAEKNRFFCFFPEFFRFLSKNFSDFRPKNFKKVFKTTYVSRGIVCSLKVFSKVLNRFGFSAETFGMVPKLLSSCPE